MKSETQTAGTATADKPATEPSTEQQTGLQQTPPAGAPAATTKVPIRMGVAPQSLDEAWRMSQFMAQSEMVPKQYHNRPADVLVGIQYGMELGFAPMQALQSIAVINGRPSVWGDGFMALIIASPLCRDHDEYYEVDGARVETVDVADLAKDTTAAVATFWRHGKTLPVTRRFSVGQAKKAGLWGKQGPWQTYPDRMLRWRAVSWAGRDAFPDLLRGITTAEEARDLPPGDAIDLPPAQPVQPRRASEARTTTEPPTRTSSPASPTATETTPAPANGQELRGLKITHTAFVRPKGLEPYYEVTAITASGTEKGFLTRDEQVYKEAASFEGTDHQVAAGVHQAKLGDRPVTVLDRIVIDEGAAPAPENGALFAE